MRFIEMAALTFFFTVSSVSALSVDLTVKESAGVAVSNHPVTVVVPLPEGAYQSENVFKMIGPSATAIPAQFSSLTRWWLKDKSIRNLLVTFPADVAANGSTVYSLQDGSTPGAVDRTLKVTSANGIITVTTGPLQFTVNTVANKIFDQVWLDRNGNGTFEENEKMLAEIADQGGILTDRDSVTAILCSGLKNCQAIVEESGPVRAVIKIETPTEISPGNPFGYKLRIYAYRGRSDIRVDFTLKNAVPGKDGRILYFDDFSIKLKPALTQPTVTYGNAPAISGVLGSGSRLLQASTTSFTVTGSLSGSGARSEGWIDMSDTGRGVMVAVKNFWQQFPKGLEATAAGELYVRLWPKGAEDSSGIYWLGDMQYKTHTVYFYFHGGNEPVAALSGRAKLLERKPVAVVPVSWYAQTRMPVDLMGVVPLNAPVAAPYWAPGVPDTLGWRNYWNYGRKYTPTTGGTPREWRADDFMVCGDPKWLYMSENWARHSADIRPTHIDGYVHPMEANWGNFVPGGYAWRSWRENFTDYQYGAVWDGWYPYDDQHAWTQDMEDAYFYTGDRLLYDNIMNLGEIFKSRLSGPNPPSLFYPSGQANGRQMGWIFELVRGQATISGDTGAVHLLSRMAEALTDTVLDPAFGPNVAGDQAFCQSIAFQNLLNFYRELPRGYTRDKLFGALMGLGDYVSIHCWAADNRGIGHSLTDKPTPYYDNADMGDVPAMQYFLTGISQYKQKAQTVSALGTYWTNWQGARPGKAVSYVLNFPRADTIAPPAITDLTAFYTTRSTDTVLLQWTTPTGAKRYDVRSSEKTIVPIMTSDQTATSENWWHCDPHPYLKTASGAGARDQLLVTGKNVRARNFLVRSFDAVGDETNLSGFSNIVQPQCCFNPDTVTTGIKTVMKKDFRPQSISITQSPMRLTIQMHSGKRYPFAVRLCDMAGKVVFNGHAGGDELLVLNTRPFGTGVYYLSIVCKGQVFGRSVVLVR